MAMTAAGHPVIRTPDQRLRVFVSSTLGELATERQAAHAAVERLRLTPVMFELGARPHPPRQLYRAYLAQSHVFVGIYWQRYGWIAPGETISGLEDEYRLAGDRPRLLYIKHPAPDRESRLAALIEDFASDDRASYKRFSTPDELAELVETDLAVLLSERFESVVEASEQPSEAAAPPLPVTRTVGRAEAVAWVTGALDAGARLVTLTGPGGVGKTRLAIEAARNLVDANLSVHFISLAAVDDADRALRTIVESVGARVEGRESLIDVLADGFGTTPSVLVLDNIEQLAGIGAQLSELLQRTATVQVLTTSRRALRVRAEQEIRVDPLPLPGNRRTAQTLADEPAVQLFVDRAQAVAPAFTPTDENVGTIAEICRNLDGLPLAIELAAARIRVLSPDALLSRLSDPLALLTSGGADLPRRQRTLRSAIDWSHDLLDDNGRTLFAWLSVFAGGWTLDAAEAVCGDGDFDVMETMAWLLDDSLITSFPDSAGGDPRFSMLETLREYAAERLEERGESDERHQRHLNHFRALAERAQPFLCGPGQREWLIRLDPERANLRRAVATALDAGDDAAVIEMAWDVIVYYFVRDAVDEPDSWLARVANAGHPLPSVLEAKLHSLHALTRIHHGDYSGVQRRLTDSLDTFRQHDMDFETAVALHQLGFVRFAVDDDVPGSIECLQESSALFDQITHDWGVSLVQAMLGSVFAASGDLTSAEECQREALARARKIDSEPQIVQALLQTAFIRLLGDRGDDALPFLAEASGLLRRGGYRTDAANCLDALAAIALQRGDVDWAIRAARVARQVRHRLGVSPWPTIQSFIDEVEAKVAAKVGGDVFAGHMTAEPAEDLYDTLDQTLVALHSTS
jgi:predicted ATPase